MAAWCSSAAAPRVVTSWPSKAVSGGTAPFRGRFRPARRADRPVPEAPTRSLSPSDAPLDVRILPRPDLPGPVLLVSASRKAGCAVERNAFRRRVRMALMHLLQERPLPGPAVVWVRPSRRSPLGCRLPYAQIEGQLRLALSRVPGTP